MCLDALSLLAVVEVWLHWLQVVWISLAWRCCLWATCWTMTQSAMFLGIQALLALTLSPSSPTPPSERQATLWQQHSAAAAPAAAQQLLLAAALSTLCSTVFWWCCVLLLVQKILRCCFTNEADAPEGTGQTGVVQLGLHSLSMHHGMVCLL